MSKVELKQLNVDNEVFKRTKKYKRTIYILQKDDTCFKQNDKLLIINNKNNKKLKRKIVKIYPQDNLVELKNSLNKNSKYIYPKTFEGNDKITAIEFKYNKKIFRKILLGILIIVLLFFSYRFINEFITDLKVNKFRNNINNIEKELVSYVFIEINPSLVLTVNDNNVSDVACLNDDCIEIYNDINIKGKNINESIDDLYNLSKEKGYDVSNGVKIKTTDELDIEDKDYITVEYIDETTKNELLTNVKNNEEIKNNSNDNYYVKLWEELKKDSDYDKVYSCNMSDNELKCFIKRDIFPEEGKEYTYADVPFFIQKQNDVARVLNKFGIKTEIEVIIPSFSENLSVYVNDLEFSCNMTGSCNPSPRIFDDVVDISNYNTWGDLNLFDNEVGLNLLNPNDVLNNLLYEEENQIYDDYYGYEFSIMVEKVCDININNCKNYGYTYCDLERINETNDGYYQYAYTNCKTIDSETYKNYYDEYVIKGRSWGCIPLDEFGIIGQSVCELYESYVDVINSEIVTDYVRCNGEINSKNCTSISLSKEEFEDIEFSSPQDNGKIYKEVYGVSKVCELDYNTLKFKCVNKYSY